MKSSKGNIIGRVIFLVVMFNIVSSMFGIRQVPFLSSFSAYSWIILIFIGMFVPSVMRQISKDNREQFKEERDDYVVEKPIKPEKSEYDFDDEFAIDPKDYE